MKSVINELTNINEHSYDIRIEEIGSEVFGKDVYYGHAGMITVTNDKVMDLLLQGLDLKYDRITETYYSADVCHIICGIMSNQMLYIGSNKYNLRFYNREKVMELLSKAGANVVV